MESEQPATYNGEQDQQTSTGETPDLRWFSNLEQAFPAIHRRIRNLVTEYAHDIHPDLDGAGYGVLVQIRYRAPIRAAQLAELINIDKGAISRQVRLLLDLKLIDRVADPDDSRASLLIPTEEGTCRIDQSQVARVRRFQATFPHLSALFESLLTARVAEDDKTKHQ